MKKMTLDELQPGMFTATPVYNNKGQLLIPFRTVLSTQHISRLSHYNVEYVHVFLEEELNDDFFDEIMKNHRPHPTHAERIRNSEAFRIFKASYQSKTTFIKQSLNDIIKQQKVDQNLILEEIHSLFQQNATNLSIFDMLHNMREIDDSTYAHSINVAIIARILGQWLNFSAEDLDTLTLCGLFHDIGKCMIDSAIIQKPGKLTEDEYNRIKEHTTLGYDILKNLDINQHIQNAALMHHERCDGSGYPLGLAFDQIDPFSQIISIADVYDAMTSNRCYRDGLCPFEVIATFEKHGLNLYTPQFILTFLEHIADSYTNNDVMLNDNSIGTVVLINRQQLSRPIVKLADNTFINLLEHPELFIDKIL